MNALVVERLAGQYPESPGVVVHGVALKPGKPVLLSVVAGVPIIVLPGFPTSAIFTFHEFVAPLLRRLSGQRAEATRSIDAVAPMRINSVPGRTEYSLVDGVVRVKPLMKALADGNMPAVALTDQSNLFAMVKFTRAALAAGRAPRCTPRTGRMADPRGDE